MNSQPIFRFVKPLKQWWINPQKKTANKQTKKRTIFSFFLCFKEMNLFWYSLGIVSSIFILFFVLKLNRFDLQKPLHYQADDLLYLSMIQTMNETGWYYFADRVGYPDQMDFREFPGSEGWLHLAIIKGIGFIEKNPIFQFNLFYLLTFPFTMLTTMISLRYLKFRWEVNIVVSLLFTFTPYHFFRMPHLFLAAYYMIPLTMLLIINALKNDLRSSEGEFDCLADNGSKERANRISLFTQGIICFLTGFAGVYYAFFACFFLCLSGVVSVLKYKVFRHFLHSLFLCGIIFTSLIITLIPSLAFQWQHPQNADRTRRLAAEAEMYGLKITDLLLPIQDHRYPPLCDLRSIYLYSGTPLVNENSFASMGGIASVGFILLLLTAVFPRKRPDWINTLAICAIGGLLFATIGGFGSLLNFVLSPWIRAYNRISIYLVFFSLLFMAYHLNRFFVVAYRHRWTSYLVLGILLVFGLADQTSPSMVPNYNKLAEEYTSDVRFIQKLESELQNNPDLRITEQNQNNLPKRVPIGWIFQLPYRFFPEDSRPPIFSYGLFKGYLFSRDLIWSFGSFHGQYGDMWTRELLDLSTEKMIDRLCAANCAGIYIDRSGYTDHGIGIETQLKKYQLVPTVISDNKELVFYSLKNFQMRLKSKLGAEKWDCWCEETANPLLILYQNGFYPEEKVGNETFRWSDKNGQFEIVNTRSKSIRIKMKMAIRIPKWVSQTKFYITVNKNREKMEFTSPTNTYESILEINPGRTKIQFECNANSVSAKDSPDRYPHLVFQILKPIIEELP